jgi:hypothetical protein
MEGRRIITLAIEWNPQWKRRCGRQSAHGRMGLGTACKAETSRMENASIENCVEKKMPLG